MKGKRCVDYIPKIGCVGSYGQPIDVACKGHKVSCPCYRSVKQVKDVTLDDVIIASQAEGRK